MIFGWIRKKIEKAAIAKRVADFKTRDNYVAPEGVQSLNPGVFELQRMDRERRNKAHADGRKMRSQ